MGHLLELTGGGSGDLIPVVIGSRSAKLCVFDGSFLKVRLPVVLRRRFTDIAIDGMLKSEALAMSFFAMRIRVSPNEQGQHYDIDRGQSRPMDGEELRIRQAIQAQSSEPQCSTGISGRAAGRRYAGRSGNRAADRDSNRATADAATDAGLRLATS